MINLTRSDCMAIAVAQAVVNRYIGLEGEHFAQQIDIKREGPFVRKVTYATPSHGGASNFEFEVIVDLAPCNNAGEYSADLLEGPNLRKQFLWNFAGSRIVCLRER